MSLLDDENILISVLDYNVISNLGCDSVKEDNFHISIRNSGDVDIFLFENNKILFFQNDISKLVNIADRVSLKYNRLWGVNHLANRLVKYVKLMQKSLKSRYIHNNQLCSVVRTVHPVGQGALYSERFIDNEGQTCFLAVYDCGSSNYEYVSHEVESYFKGEIIDLLFVSHFDKDHINGVKKLGEVANINTIIMPQISLLDRIYIVSQGVNISLIEDPADYFGALKVVYVLPENIDSNENSETVFITELSNEITSGTRVNIHPQGLWLYIPYNFDSNNRREKLLQKIKQLTILGNEFNDADKLKNMFTDKQKLSSLNNVYKTLFHDGSNKMSLILYSGCSDGLTILNINNSLSCLDGESNCCEACIYTGDTDLNQSLHSKGIVELLIEKLGSLQGRVGLMQLPHHGSIRSFNHSFLDVGNSCEKTYFASFGMLNSYKHPSLRLLEDIKLSHNRFIGVTEDRNSSLVQVICL